MRLTRGDLCQFLVDRFDVNEGELEDDTLLFSGGLLDSFSMIELIEYIERLETIKVGVMEVQLENLDSIERILRFVASKKQLLSV